MELWRGQVLTFSSSRAVHFGIALEDAKGAHVNYES